MKLLNIFFDKLGLLFILLLFYVSTYAQSIQISISGGSFSSAVQSVCPYNEIDITIRTVDATGTPYTGGSYNIVKLAGATIDYESSTSPSTYTTLPDPGSAPLYITGSTIKLQFKSATGPEAITIEDTINNVVTTLTFTVNPLAHPAFNTSNIDLCSNGTVTLNASGTGANLANTASYKWFHAGNTTAISTGIGAGSSLQITANTSSPALTSGSLLYRVEVTNGTCTDEATITVDLREPPGLEDIKHDQTNGVTQVTLSTDDVVLCPKDAQTLNTSCTSGDCTSLGDYTWEFKDATSASYTGVLSGTTVAPYITNLGTTTGTGTYNLDGQELYPPGLGPTLVPRELPPGRYDVSVTVANGFGCIGSTSVDDQIYINDYPSVELIHDLSDNNFNTVTSVDYEDPAQVISICTGKQLRFQPRACPSDEYTANAINATQSETQLHASASATNPNDPFALNGVPDYNSPCNGDYFETIRWAVFNPDQLPSATTPIDITNNGGSATYLDLSAAGGIASFDPLADTTLTSDEIGETGYPASNNISCLINNAGGSSDAINTMTLNIPTPGLYITYVEVTGANGCKNIDKLEFRVDDPTITFASTAASTGSPASSGGTLAACAGTVIDITANCDLCDGGTGGYSMNWDNPSGGDNQIDNSIVGNNTANPVLTNSIITTNSATNYAVTVTGPLGCTAVSSVNVDDVDGPGLTAADIPATFDLCTGTDLQIELTRTSNAINQNTLRGYIYKLYNSDPSVGSPTEIYSCDGSNGTLCTDVSVSGGQVILTTTGTQPTNGASYWLTIEDGSGGCAITLPIASNPLTVGKSPDIRPGNLQASYCNAGSNLIITTYTDYNTDVLITYDTTDAHNALDALTNPVCPITGILGSDTTIHQVPQFSPSPLALRSLSTIGIIKFPVFSPLTYGTFSFNLPICAIDNLPLTVTATDTTTGCSSSHLYEIDIKECVDPVLETEIYRSGVGIAQNYDGSSLNPTIPFSQVEYVCEGDDVLFRVNPNSTDTSYTNTLRYIWNTGETTSEITIPAISSSADTIYGTVIVYQETSQDIPLTATTDTTIIILDTLATLSDTVIISRPNLSLTPLDDNALVTADTAICLNEPLYSEAICTGCRSQITYEWIFEENSVPDTLSTYSVSTFDQNTVYSYTTAQTQVAGEHTLTLALTHGENCFDVFYREITVNSLPAASLERVSTGNPITAADPIYLCVGQTEDISVTGCTGCTYTWNTGSTNATLTIANQGGYYAEFTNTNGCSQTTDVAIVIESTDGYNSPVTANPSAICSGRNAVLEVAPCVGCSYDWVGPNPATGTRLHATNVAGNYYALVNNGHCIYNTSVIAISNTTIISPSITATTDSICSGQSTTLSTLNGPGFLFQWYDGNGNLIAGATDSAYTTTVADNYTVVVTQPNGCSEESPIYTITSTTFNPDIAQAGTVICSGQTVDVSTTLNAGWQYQWYRNGILLSGATGSVYSADSAGIYYAVVTNNNLCVAQTAGMSLTEATIPKPNASTNTPSICPGEFGNLSVSLCTGCSYEWHAVYDPTFSTTLSVTGYNYGSVTETDLYYATVYSQGCSENSDTIAITVETVVTPNILSSSSSVCDGVVANLSTTSCTGCSYQWLRNVSPIPGALNDPTHTVNTVAEAGNYQIAITYPNGCADTSQVLTIANGSDTVSLAIKGPPIDSVICNGVGETLIATSASGGNIPGTYLYTLFLDNTPITAFSSVTVNEYTVNTPGVYTVQMVNPDGCVALSNILPLREVSLSPILAGRATADPTSVTTSGICTDSGTVFLEVTACSNCTYDWTLNGVSLQTDRILREYFDASTSIPIAWVDSQIVGGASSVNGTGWSIANTTMIPGLSPSNPTNIAISNRDSALAATNYLMTPLIDLSSHSGNLTLNFDALHKGASTATVQVRPLGGSWSVLQTITPSTTWQSFALSLNTYTSDSIHIAFVHDNPAGSGDTLALDSVELTGLDPSTATYTSENGTAGVGIYVVNVEQDGCIIPSTPVFVADFVSPPTLNTAINTTDTSICDGQSVTLFHSDTVLTTNYSTASFRWLRNGNPINGANSSQFTTATQGIYQLEITTQQGCVDTSIVTFIRKVDPPAGLSLQFDSTVTIGSLSVTGTPLAADGDSINLNNWVFPSRVRNDSLGSGATSYFTNTPYSGALVPNSSPGLSGVDSVIFTPADSLAGYHLITYYYDTLGCSFTAQDVLEVLPPGDIIISNTNPLSVPYEACVGDSIVIITTNLVYPVTEVFVFDDTSGYVNIPITDTSYTVDTFGTSIRYSSVVSLVVPGYAYSSNLKLMLDTLPAGGTQLDSTTTPFLLIHNTDLSFAGLPTELCSNGSGIALSGNPAGGSFLVTDTVSFSNVMTNVTVGDSIFPSLINPTNFQNGSQYVDVYYSYTESYSNGNLCPSNDTVSQRIEVKDVRLTAIEYNKISASQDEELLTNLVYRAYPYEARANMPNYTVEFSGSFTNPAGNPTHFLPKTATPGTHPLTYTIKTGICSNSITNDITVLPEPTAIEIPDTICVSFEADTFSRDTALPYYAPPAFGNGYLTEIIVTSAIQYSDTYHTMVVRSKNNNQAIISLNSNPGVEQYVYDPTLLTGTAFDTLVVEYWFHRSEDSISNGANFDSLSYIVASIVKPVYIEAFDTVSIDTNIVQSFYCQDNALYLLSGAPNSNQYGGGVFTLYGGTNNYQNGDTLLGNVINPYDVNHLEQATTNYTLYYALDKAACSSRDSMTITISKGLNPSFTTLAGVDEFCDTDPNMQIVHNVVAPDTAIFKVGGIPQPAYEFSPIALNPGLHIAELQMISYFVDAQQDTFYCDASITDTFTVHALPALTMTPALDVQYCSNDTLVDVVVNLAPECPSFGPTNQTLWKENFDTGIKPSWLTTSLGGANWIGQPFMGNTVAFADTSHSASDSWLVSDSLPLITGHQYEITYMVQVGDLDPTCTGLCNASLQVLLANIQAASTGTLLNFHFDLDNNNTFVPFTVIHDHTAASGNYYLSFNNFTPAKGRAIYLDSVHVRDITPSNCGTNGIGYMTGPGMNYMGNSSYQFNPLAVTPGVHSISYNYTNTNGCTDSIVYSVTIDTTPVVSFTTLPDNYCENEPTIELTGSPLGGTFSSTLNTNLIGIPVVAPLSPAFAPVNYETNTAGQDIVQYEFVDANGCSNSAFDTIIIIPLLDRTTISQSLDPFGYGHCEGDGPTILDVASLVGSIVVDTGTFYGAGISQGGLGANSAAFYPDSAVLAMGHTGDVTITYIYDTDLGCSDTATFVTRVHAKPNVNFLNLPDSLCLNADSRQIRVTNNVITGSMGQISYIDTIPVGTGIFTVTDTGGNVVNNFIQYFDTLVPIYATPYHQLNVSYSYSVPNSLGGCSVLINDSVRIDSVPNVYFQNMQPFYCENEEATMITAQPSYSLGSGYTLVDGVQINSSFFWVRPSAMVGGTIPNMQTKVYPSYYTYTDARGCTGEVFDTFEIRPFDRITIASNYQDTFCRVVGDSVDLRPGITPAGGYFTDNLALTSIIGNYYLDLGGIITGPREITYHYTNPNTTCSNKDVFTVDLFSSPELDFQTTGGCSGTDVIFTASASNLVAGVDSITSIEWQFEPGIPFITSPLDTTPITIPDTSHQYATHGVYSATLKLENQGNCVASITKDVIISETISLHNGNTATNYFQDFEIDFGGWYNEQPLGISSSDIWQWDNNIAGPTIASPNNAAWVTVPDDQYLPGQEAWVYSPCFDFTNSQRPMISMDLWRDMLEDIDGVIMEYYDPTTQTWNMLGDKGYGLNWYQSNFVLSRPGNQASILFPRGWTGVSAIDNNGSGFESARFRLDQFKGQNNVRFRIAFASSSQTVVNPVTGKSFNDGAAFDNVYIGERTRNVLVEHFSNENYSEFGLTGNDIDQGVYTKLYNQLYGLDAVLIQYQTQFPTSDPIHGTNSGELNARGNFYSLSESNQIRINGHVKGDGRSMNLGLLDLDREMLQSPDFDIDIDQIVITSNGGSGDKVDVQATVTPLVDKAYAEYGVYTVLVQDSIIVNGNLKLNEALKLLPYATGQPFFQSWTAGAANAVQVNQSWEFGNSATQTALSAINFDPNSLEAIVFIQNADDTVYQVASTQDLSWITPVNNVQDEIAVEITNVVVYPNPSSYIFNVKFDQALEGEYDWRLIDVTGRVLKTGKAEQGVQEFTIDTDGLVTGTYFFTIHNENVYTQRKLVVIKN